jgi:aspartate/methionine/tyrosine aminotransferase
MMENLISMKYARMPIEIEAPEQLGYEKIDCNLTESSYTDFKFKDLGINIDDLVIAYVDHRGHAGLRGLLSNETQGIVKPDQVLITAGAAQALFIISTTLLSKGDELVVVRPNYATNIETPRAIEADIRLVELKFEEQWRIDPAKIAASISPRTKLVSITVPHNPTGSMMSAKDLNEIIEITRKAGCYLLVDETYREMSFNGILPHSAIHAPHVISVASFSKTFGLPGIRIGWLMTQNEAIFEKFFAAKEQIQICGSALDEEIAFQFYKRKKEFLPQILENLKRRFGILKTWMNTQTHLEWIEPVGGCVAFPRFKKEVLEKIDLEVFYRTLNSEFSTFVGPGHWFEQSKSYMRLGYGWPSDDELKRGLQNITRAIEKSFKK